MSVAELDYNNLFKATAEGDKDTSMSIGVFKGNASIVVFKAKESRPAIKIGLPGEGRVILMKDARKILTGGPDQHISRTIYKWNPEEKKMESAGTIIIGRNDRNVAFIGISGPSFTGVRFPFRISGAWSSESMTESEKSEFGLEHFINVIERDVPNAISHTSVKREFTGSSQGSGQSSSSHGPAF